MFGIKILIDLQKREYIQMIMTQVMRITMKMKMKVKMKMILIIKDHIPQDIEIN